MAHFGAKDTFINRKSDSISWKLFEFEWDITPFISPYFTPSDWNFRLKIADSKLTNVIFRILTEILSVDVYSTILRKLYVWE